MDDYASAFLDRVVQQDMLGSLDVIDSALDANIPPSRILLTVVNSAMEEIGRQQANQEITLSQVYMFASIADTATNRLLAVMPEIPISMTPVVLGTIEGDHHSLGRKMVGSFLRVGGMRVIDLGADVPPYRFVDVAEQEGARVICVSALLLHTAENICQIRAMLRERNMERNTKLIVGGAAFNMDPALVQQVGADATAVNALGAVAEVRALMRAVQ